MTDEQIAEIAWSYISNELYRSGPGLVLVAVHGLWRAVAYGAVSAEDMERFLKDRLMTF